MTQYLKNIKIASFSPPEMQQYELQGPLKKSSISKVRNAQIFSLKPHRNQSNCCIQILDHQLILLVDTEILSNTFLQFHQSGKVATVGAELNYSSSDSKTIRNRLCIWNISCANNSELSIKISTLVTSKNSEKNSKLGKQRSTGLISQKDARAKWPA